MAASQQAWTGTPAFELFRRGLITQSINHFRGLNAYTSIPALGPEWAQDLLNVIIAGSGNISKLRLPTTISIVDSMFASGPNSFWDFQQANGTRQVLASFGNYIVDYQNDLSDIVIIDNNPLNNAPWSFSEANNIMFGANGKRMQKWDGSNWYQWGIDAPTVAPSLSVTGFTISAVRSSNVVTVTAPNAPMPGLGDVIQLSGMSDVTYDGFFTVATIVSGDSYTFASAGTDGSATGTQTLTYGEAFNYPITAITREANVVTATVASTFRIAVGDNIFVAGVTDASFDTPIGLGFAVTAVTPTTVTWAQAGPDANSNAGTISYALIPTVSLTWAYAYGNSKTGHVSNISPLTTTPGTSVGKKYSLTATPSPDPQVDTYYWFRSLDGGADYYELTAVTTVDGLFGDTTPDGALDQAIRGPLINTPPPTGLYTGVGQGRVVVFNIVGSPQDVIYSGYDQIFIGRPEECFPPNNRLRLSIGADSIAGGAVMQAGIVAFSQTGRMYMLRGQLEDITLAVPVNFSSYLEELPWTLGCASHFAIAVTPYGLVWLAGDKTLQLFDGRNEPVDISVGIYPLLRQITPGTESQCVAAYFNWLERDWYVLLAAVNGSLTPNRLFFFAFNKVLSADPTQANTLIESIEMFVSDLPAAMPGITWIGMLTNSKLQRMFCMASNGVIQQLPVSSDETNGLTLDTTLIPPTSGLLNAFWRGGYYGNDQPQRSKMFRWATLVSDIDPNSFKMTFRLVDYNSRTFLQPEIVGPTQLQPGLAKMGINRRVPRLSTEINFPAADISANVLELQVAQIATSDR